MTYQERKTLVNLMTAIAILIGYVTFNFSVYEQVGALLLQDSVYWGKTMLKTIGVAVIAGVLIQVVFHFGLTLRNEVTEEPVEIEDFDDERDKNIASKALKVQFWVFGLGFVLTLVLIAAGAAVGIALNCLFASLLIGMIGFSAVQLYHYRKGV